MSSVSGWNCDPIDVLARQSETRPHDRSSKFASYSEPRAPDRGLSSNRAVSQWPGEDAGARPVQRDRNRISAYPVNPQGVPGTRIPVLGETASGFISGPDGASRGPDIARQLMSDFGETPPDFGETPPLPRALAVAVAPQPSGPLTLSAIVIPPDLVGTLLQWGSIALLGALAILIGGELSRAVGQELA